MITTRSLQFWELYIKNVASSTCKSLRVKLRLNDRNTQTQHIATLLGATCCVRLATVLRHIATCWVLLAQIWPFSNLSQQHPTCRNTSQRGGQTHTTCCAQQCCDMLLWHVAIVWPGLYRNAILTGSAGVFSRLFSNKWYLCLIVLHNTLEAVSNFFYGVINWTPVETNKTFSFRLRHFFVFLSKIKI